jgi:hypothetical protein
MIEIIKAWYKWIINKQSTQSLRRLSICLKCENNKGGICKDCGCVVRAKVMCTICECKKWD